MRKSWWLHGLKFVLLRILLGGLLGRRHGMHWRERMAMRWEQMSDDERARFREGMRRRCGRAEARSDASSSAGAS